MGLGNPLEAIVHHLLIKRMVGLGYRDGFRMLSALVCIVYTLNMTYDES